MSLQTYSAADVARRWQNAPQLDPETERLAALATIEFLTAVREKLSRHIDDMAAGRAASDGSDLHEVWDFSSFDPKHLDFLLPTLGEGEVKILLFNGEARAADTGIPGLWRVQAGDDGRAANSFVLGRLPRTVLVVSDRGETEVPKLVNPSADVFAAPAILEELGHELKSEAESGRIERLSDDPAFMVELQRQPLSPGDMTALLSTLGTGDIEVELQGFAHSRFTRTRVRNLWRSRIINYSGKTLLDAFVVARVPPEVPVSAEEFPEAVRKCTDLIEWIRHDLERGTLGGRREVSHA